MTAAVSTTKALPVEGGNRGDEASDKHTANHAAPAKALTVADPATTTARAQESSEITPKAPSDALAKANTDPGATGGKARNAKTAHSVSSREHPSIAAKAKVKTEAAIRFARQAEQLSLLPHDNHDEQTERTTAVEARFITPRDPVIETASGDRLPAVPLVEAQRLNQLKSEVADLTLEEAPTREQDAAESKHSRHRSCGSEEQKSLERANEARAGQLTDQDTKDEIDHSKISHVHPEGTEYDGGGPEHASRGFGRTGVPLKASAPPSRTNPLFPPLPLYGPPSLHRSIQCLFLRFTSFFLSLGFLAVIVLGSLFTSIPGLFRRAIMRLTFRDPYAKRPFLAEEKKRAATRKKLDSEWMRKRRRRASFDKADDRDGEEGGEIEEFIPTEGGKDPLRCELGYYARRLGLDMEEYKVHTEDGFIISLYHVYNPLDYTPATQEERSPGKPEVFPDEAAYDPEASPCSRRRKRNAPTRYPVLLIHGLLQSAGAYCCNDDDSLAFYLAKSGYDVWLGNNRCGFHPEHTLLSYGDPRFWCFNIRQMGVMDLPALISRVLSETGFPKLGLVCHSQGTTQTFVALAKEQRPDLGKRISVFCALAPAVYAGPLIGKMYFKFMRVISPAMFRIFFGIHAFIPFMMTMHKHMPGRLYGLMGYHVFSFLFNWTDTRWDRGLRDRLFRFSPVYVSAESMRWWLGRECFAKHKCILTTREEAKKEDDEDAAEDSRHKGSRAKYTRKVGSSQAVQDAAAEDAPDDSDDEQSEIPEDRGRRAWYDANAPPMAIWVAGSDELVDGRRLLRRFDRGREPHVRIVHAKVIEEYEHLDVLWAMDVIEQVGHELLTVIWQTAERTEGVAIPKGCSNTKAV